MIPIWAIYALLSAFFAAIIPIISKRAFNDLASLDSTLSTTIRAVVMAIFLIITSAFMGKFKLISNIPARPLLFIALSGIAGAMSWLCYFLAVKLVPQDHIAAVSALDKLSVIFVLFLAFLFFGEKLDFHTVLGAILVTIGAILISVK